MSLNLSKFESKVNLLYKANTPLSTISKVLKKDYRSIINAINRINKKISKTPTISRVKDGRITKLNSRAKRQLNRDLERSLKKTNKRLLFKNNIKVSLRSLQRFIKEEGYTINIANKKPLINKKKAIKRVSYSKEQLRRLKNKEFSLRKIIFSDESGIEAGKGARSEYYRKRGKKGVGKARISMTNTSKFKVNPNILKYFILRIVLF